MQIQDIGGEFKLIENLTKDFLLFDSNIIQGIGDDCAVIDQGDKYQLISTDSLVANDHFNLNWSTPQQVGMKALEVNVSDILACGGVPKTILVSLVLPPKIEVKIVQEIYQGVLEKCKKYQIDLIGGDTTHGSELVINVTILGEVEKPKLKLRSYAKAEDLICVTGNLGGSTGGLEFLRKFNDAQKLLQTFPFLYKHHLEPVARFDIYDKILSFANAMIDVSDGLASEVRHICEQSKLGSEVYFEKIPLHLETKLCATKLGQSAENWALSGGEDFELIFTITPENYQKMLANLTEREQKEITIVGKILPKSEEVYLLKNGEKEELKGGYDHFKKD